MSRAGAAMQQARIWPLIVVAVFVALVGFSEVIAVSRIYQVDEVQNVATAHLIGAHAPQAYVFSAPLMMLGPLSWATGAFDDSATIFNAARLLFLPIFWLNIVLIVVATGVRLRSRTGIVALLFAATLAPLWDYGLEVRHDNVLLTFMLAGFAFARRPTSRPGLAAIAVGVCVGLMQAVALKAFVYSLPIVVLALLVDADLGRLRRLAGIVVGIATAVFVVVAAHALAGTLDIFLRDTQALFTAAQGATRFSPLPTLLRLPRQAPLFSALVIVCVVVTVPRVVAAVRARRLEADDPVVDVLWFLGAAAAILINPTPFAYNVVLLVPHGAVVVVRVVARGVAGVAAALPRAQVAALVAVVAMVHVVAWFDATHRHLDMTNARQELLMRAAEALTDPTQHRVFDGAGLVASRLPPDPHWLLHTLTMRAWQDGRIPPLRAQLTSAPTPVLLPSYRFAMLGDDDLDFVRDHYVEVAGDFLVSGVEVGAGSRRWTALVAGRYALEVDGSVRLDDTVVTSGIIELSRGEHTIDVVVGRGARVSWVGPMLEAPVRLPPGEARTLFVNWY